MLRLWTWNVNGTAVWDTLAESGIDVALLQEAPPRPAAWSGMVVPDPSDGWATAGWSAGRLRRRTAIVQVSGAVHVTPRPVGAVGDLDAAGIPVSRPGTLAAADVEVGEASVTVVSMYGGWERSADGRRTLYADAAAHPVLSDLSALVTSQNSHRIIAAGDLNILNRYGEHGSADWAAR